MDNNHQDITVYPASLNTDQFNRLYAFLSEQVLDDLGRKKLFRIITNDTTPIQVEDDLMDSIQKTFNRFEVYDYPSKTWYGEIVTCNDDTSSNEAIDMFKQRMETLAFETFPFPVEVHLWKVCTETLSINPYAANMVKIDLDDEWISGSYINNPDKLNIPEYYIDMQTRSHIDHRLDEIINKYPTSIMHKIVEYNRVMFMISKIASSKSEFENIGIRSSDVAEMLMGDLIDKTIEIEKSSPLSKI